MQPWKLNLLLSSALCASSAYLAYCKRVQRLVEQEVALEKAAAEKAEEEKAEEVGQHTIEA